MREDQALDVEMEETHDTKRRGTFAGYLSEYGCSSMTTFGIQYYLLHPDLVEVENLNGNLARFLLPVF